MGDEVALQIRDTGIGISADMLSRTFDLFVQADQASTRTQGGPGIGLTLVKNLVECIAELSARKAMDWGRTVATDHN